MGSTGVVFRPQSPPEELRAAVEAAEEAAVDELWLWEDCFLEGGLTTATAALAWSPRVRVGIGLLPVPFRNPALAAMETNGFVYLAYNKQGQGKNKTAPPARYTPPPSRAADSMGRHSSM